jgi:putative SOS response-associated peptidase YedK
MCGRFRLARKKEILEEAFEIDDLQDDQDWAPVLTSGFNPDAASRAVLKNAVPATPSLFADLTDDRATDGATDDAAVNATDCAASQATPPNSIFAPRYNIAPGQAVLTVRQDAVRNDQAKPVRTLAPMRWGLIPNWSNDSTDGYKRINARSESAARRPSFNEPLRLRRCLIPADGFYEWKREGKRKLPFCFTLAGESVFAFAGIWDRWKSPQGQIIESCSILTTGANELIEDIHDRMPVILAPDAYGLWLAPGFGDGLRIMKELKPLLKPYPAEAMRRYRVSQRVNQVKYDDAECAAEIDAA